MRSARSPEIWNEMKYDISLQFLLRLLAQLSFDIIHHNHHKWQFHFLQCLKEDCILLLSHIIMIIIP